MFISCGSTRSKGDLVPIPGLSALEVHRSARGKKVALLIGVDQFEDPFWPSLIYAGKDARDLASLLTSPEIGGFDEVIVLATPEETTRNNIFAAIDRLAQRAPRNEDSVVLYLSGHGTLALDPRGAPERILVARDTRHEQLHQSGIAVAELVRRFDALPSQRKALILATCHSGSGKSLLTDEVAATTRGLKGPAIEEVSDATMIFSAAEMGQPAREDDRLENDVYTHFFLIALREGADANGDGAVTATEAHDYARRRTFEFTDGRQIPTVHASISGVDPLVLAGEVRRPGLPVLIGYAPRLAGLEVRVGGRSKGVLPGAVVLDPGPQAVSLMRGDQRVAEETIDLAPGERLDAQELVDASLPSWRLSASIGALALLDQNLGSALLEPLPAAVVSGRYLRWDALEPVIDLTFGYADQQIAIAARSLQQTIWLASAGAGAMFVTALGSVEFYGGPHLSYVFISRSVDATGLRETQHFGALIPGLIGGVALDVASLELEIQGRVHYLPLVVDDETRGVLTAGLLFGVGGRF